MAVYTKINQSDLKDLLNNYEIGELLSFEEIAEGVENSNFKIITKQNVFILTIFEKRVHKSDLPFFIELMKYLNSYGFECPKPIPTKKNEFVSILKEKPCAIVSFIEGSWIRNIKNTHCQQLGQNLAKLHSLTSKFSLKRKNSIGFDSWQNLFDSFKLIETKTYKDVYEIIVKEIDFLNTLKKEELNLRRKVLKVIEVFVSEF